MRNNVTAESLLRRTFAGGSLHFSSHARSGQATLAEVTASHPARSPSRPLRRIQRFPRLLLMLLLYSSVVAAQDWTENAEGRVLGQAVYERPASIGRAGDMHFKLTNKRGRSRERLAMMVRTQDEHTTRVAIFFKSPAAIQNTAFLSHEHDHQEDDSWLYLPATDRVRRLPAAERGDAFIGSDLSYGDIRDNFRFPTEHWRFRSTGMRTKNGKDLRVLEGLARSEESAREMGYGRFEALIDEDTLFPVEVAYFDVYDQPLKQTEVMEIGRVGDAWVALAFSVRNLQTGHRTDITFEGMRAVPNLDERVFQPAALVDGVPRIR